MSRPIIKWGLGVIAMVAAGLIVWLVTENNRVAPHVETKGSNNTIIGSSNVVVGDQYTFESVEYVDQISEVVLIREDIRLPVPFSKTAASQLSITIPPGTDAGEYGVEFVKESGEVVDLGQPLLVSSPAGLATAPLETSLPTQPIPPTPTPRPTNVPTKVAAALITSPSSTSSSIGSELVLGSILTGNISHPLTTISYTYQGKADDRVLIRMLRTSGDLNPQLRIYHPDGSPHCAGAQRYPQYALMELECTLDADGTYSLVTSDLGGDGTGGFSLTVQGTNEPPNATPLQLGEPTAISIANPIAIGTLGIVGQKNERILLRLSETSGDVNSQFRVYRPDGTLACQQYDRYKALLEQECVLDSDGPYTVLITDAGADATGEITILVISTN